MGMFSGAVVEPPKRARRQEWIPSSQPAPLFWFQNELFRRRHRLCRGVVAGDKRGKSPLRTSLLGLLKRMFDDFNCRLRS